MKIESTHLLTLSAFVDQQKEYSTFSARTAEEIISYNDFLKQPLKIEMFDVSSDECIFKNFEVAGNSAMTKKGFHFNFFFKKETGIHSFMTLERLAEATKEAPLKFKKQPYFDNEEIY